MGESNHSLQCIHLADTQDDSRDQYKWTVYKILQPRQSSGYVLSENHCHSSKRGLHNFLIYCMGTVGKNCEMICCSVTGRKNIQPIISETGALEPILNLASLSFETPLTAVQTDKIQQIAPATF